MKNLIEEKLIGLCHCSRQWADRSSLLLIAFRICGIQSVASQQASSSLRAGFSVATLAGSFRLEIHCSGRAPQEIPQSIGRDQPPSSNKHGTKLAFPDQEVKRAPR
jgi:hypothetical protein